MTYLAFIHIMAVLWFIGGIIAVNVLMMRASRSKDTTFIRISVDYAHFFETFFSLPGATIGGITGVLLAWRAAFVIALGYMLPDLFRTRRLAGEAAAKGEMTPELTKALANPGPPLVGMLLSRRPNRFGGLHGIQAVLIF